MARSIIFEVEVIAISDLPVVRFVDAMNSALTSCPRGISVGLLGELGAGKTTFVRELAKYLSIDPKSVTSPTYTLQQIYPLKLDTNAPQIAQIEHWDVYRLGSLPVELSEPISRNTLQLIEWSDKFAHPVDYSLVFSGDADEKRHVALFKE